MDIHNYICLFDWPNFMTFEALAYLDDNKRHRLQNRNATIELSIWPDDNYKYRINGRADMDNIYRHWISYEVHFDSNHDCYVLLDLRERTIYEFKRPF